MPRGRLLGDEVRRVPGRRSLLAASRDRFRRPSTSPSRPAQRPLTIDYLVAGFRITTGPDSTTPGARTHIRGLLNAWSRDGSRVRLFLVSSVPGLRRFGNIRESTYTNSSDAKIWVADVVRIFASLWAGAVLFASRLLRPAPDVVVERGGVLQSLISFHPHKGSALRVVEANGINSRETVKDRNILKSVRLAEAVERHMFRRADLVVAVSENLKQEVMAFSGIGSNEIVVVPNGVDESLSRLPRRESEDCVIGYSGALTTWQHLDRMVQVFHDRLFELEEAAGRTVRLEFVGHGIEFDNIHRLRTELGLEDRVIMWGPKPHAESLRIMSAWHIGFAGHRASSSTTMYHSPLKLYEYGALGLITVCTPSADADSLAADGIPIESFDDDDGLGNALLAAALAFSAQSTETVEWRRGVMRDRHSWSARSRRIIAEIDRRQRHTLM